MAGDINSLNLLVIYIICRVYFTGYLYILLTTGTIYNRKMKAQQNEMNTFGRIKARPLAFEIRTDSNKIPLILLLLV